VGASDYRLLCGPRPYVYGGSGKSKKGTNGKMLPNHSNVTPEEVRKFLKSTVYEMIEAGDFASAIDTVIGA
jgi:hypothetical protein